VRSAGWRLARRLGSAPCGAPAAKRPEAPEISRDSPAGDAAGLIQWAGSAGFSRTRLRPGYDVKQVDAFLEAIRDTFLGIRHPPLTADEVRGKRFAHIFRGGA